MLKVVFAIEAPARFVDQIVPEITHVRTGECVITAVGLQKTESSEGNVIARSRIPGTDKSLCVVNDIHAVFIGKIVVHAKSPQIPSRTSGKQRLISAINLSGGKAGIIHRHRRSRALEVFWKVNTNKLLHVRIEETRRYGDELLAQAIVSISRHFSRRQAYGSRHVRKQTGIGIGVVDEWREIPGPEGRIRQLAVEDVFR